MTSENRPATGPLDPNRRRLLAGLTAIAATAGTGLLAGCGIGSSESGVGVSAKNETQRSLGLGARFPDGYAMPTALATGSPQRAPYVLTGPDGWPVVDEAPDYLELELRPVRDDGGLGDIVESQTVSRHGVGQATPYYPFRFTATEPGDYVVEGSTAGTALEDTHYLRIADPASMKLIQIGDTLPAVPTPTSIETLGVEPICTLSDGPCAFHGTSLDVAIGRPGATALLVSTPRFCQQDVCGPTVGLLASALDGRHPQEEWTVIHAEVYTGPDAGDFSTTPVVAALGLTFEPSLVIADSTGKVTAALHFTMDAVEVAEALGTAL